MVFSFIGSGNVATHFAKQVKYYGYSIEQVYSNNLINAQHLSELVGAHPINHLSKLNKTADVYIIAVKDDLLPQIVKSLFLPGKLILHTSGFSPIELLSTVSDRYGVVWPMRMIRSNTPINQKMNVVINGNNDSSIQSIHDLFIQFPWKIEIVNDSKRMKMHVMATFTANFSNHLYQLAFEYCQKENIPFHTLYSIIEQTAISIQTNNPSELQAGPAFRGDESMIKAHLDLLNGNEDIAQLYQLFSESIGATYHQKSNS
ncbi:MAG: DUF2520 domain-containing protein [Sediminibacterium sp.]|nr:DUF2520 domain-containing protein [Sediminibacterium sp.]TXT34214.1 MAG: hypothetical protein FD136_439 [Chitinophagaceae bacterium]